MKKHEHIVSGVVPGSIAEELEIGAGDRLLAVDGHEIEDIFDYQFYTEDEEIVLLIEKPDGEQWELEIEKEADEDLGIGSGGGSWTSTAHAVICLSSALLTRCPRG